MIVPKHPDQGCTCAEGRIVSKGRVRWLPGVHDCRYVAERNAREAPPVVMVRKRCERCGEGFETARQWAATKRYCSEVCQSREVARRRRQRRRLTLVASA